MQAHVEVVSNEPWPEWRCPNPLCNLVHTVQEVNRDGMTCPSCKVKSGALASCETCGAYHDGDPIICDPCFQAKVDRD